MKIAIYGDVHLTKKMGNIQSEWNDSAIKVFSNLYDDFRTHDIESAICLGDFFDAPRLEAKSVHVVTKVLSIINDSPFPTYFLLGNHEIFDEDSNILDYLSEYENIIPVTTLQEYEGKLFIPYNVPLEDVPEDMMKGKYLFTHHDIYGSELAGGKVKASFGTQPSLMTTAKKVFNGHVHLNSSFGNIINVGSLLKSQQGELRVGEFPKVYYLDTNTGSLSYDNIKSYFIAPLSVTPENYMNSLNYYPESVKFIIRLDYKEDSQISLLDIEHNPRVLKSRMNRDVSTSSMDSEEVKRSTVDIKEMVTNYIHNDSTVSDVRKERLVALGLELLGASVC